MKATFEESLQICEINFNFEMYNYYIKISEVFHLSTPDTLATDSVDFIEFLSTPAN